MDWKAISQEHKLSEAFIEEHKHHIDWEQLSKQPSLSEAFIEKWKDDLDRVYISLHQKLSLSFVQRNIDYIFTPYLARNTYLTEDIIEFFSEKWVSTEWYSISEYAMLTESFIEKYIEKWDWSRISDCQSFSFAFAKKHKNNLFWRALVRNPHIDFTNEQWVELQDLFPKHEVTTTDTTFIQEGFVQLHKSIQEFAKSFPKVFSKEKK